MAARHSRIRPGGFSILEVLFASSILIIGLASTAGVYGVVSGSFAHQRDMAVATGVAEAFMEQVAILPQSSALLDAGNHPARAFNKEGRRVSSGPAERFTLRWTIDENVPIAGMKEVVVTVTWEGRRQHQVELFTYRE